MPPRTHRLLLVELNGERWIADVGFGGQTLTAPIRLLANEEQETPHGLYRLLSEGTTGCCSSVTTSTGSRCTSLT
jgi:N-hydroxyarylamine O-acetyltransferase